MGKGDIVVIPFPYTDLNGNKLRPSVILAQTNLDITVCFITTLIGWQELTDVLLRPNPTNGLKKLSLIRTSKIATLDKSLAKGLLGKLSPTELSELDEKLKILFTVTLTKGTCCQQKYAADTCRRYRTAWFRSSQITITHSLITKRRIN